MIPASDRYPKNGPHEVWYFDLVEVGHDESEPELAAGVSEGGGATGGRWRAQRSGGGAVAGEVVGEVGEDVGELGWAGTSRRGADRRVGAGADERSGRGAGAIAARGCEAADGERDPKKGGVLHEGVEVKYAWLDTPIDSYPVRPMCELLGVSASRFYAARSRAPSARATEQVQIVAEIRRAQTRQRGRYGRRRMTAEGVPFWAAGQ